MMFTDSPFTTHNINPVPKPKPKPAAKRKRINVVKSEDVAKPKPTAKPKPINVVKSGNVASRLDSRPGAWRSKYDISEKKPVKPRHKRPPVSLPSSSSETETDTDTDEDCYKHSKKKVKQETAEPSVHRSPSTPKPVYLEDMPPLERIPAPVFSEFPGAKGWGARLASMHRQLGYFKRNQGVIHSPQSRLTQPQVEMEFAKASLAAVHIALSKSPPSTRRKRCTGLNLRGILSHFPENALSLLTVQGDGVSQRIAFRHSIVDGFYTNPTPYLLLAKETMERTLTKYIRLLHGPGIIPCAHSLLYTQQTPLVVRSPTMTTSGSDVFKTLLVTIDEKHNAPIRPLSPPGCVKQE